MVYLQVIWDNVRIFHGATPSAPLNKLALHVGDIRSHDGMQAFGFAHPAVQSALWLKQQIAQQISGQTPQHSHGRPPRNLHLEEQQGLVSRERHDSAAPSRKRPAEPSLKDWQTQARALLGPPQQAST
ncbi:g4829 [Coccomyxa viridis]|uniref:G4829 protein n=1 Tax=Coccomyxa viridis TaxID=1274662 RepID=A0ABP1FSQ4_9CHLO